jgi:hypothetical protein
MPLLSSNLSLLLALQMRVRNLSGVHAGKPLGYVLQRHHLAMPGLRRLERIRKPITAPPPENDGRYKGLIAILGFTIPGR